MSSFFRSQTAVIGLAAVVLALAAIAGLPMLIQAAAALAVLILLPGMALARLTPVTDAALRLLLTLALGLATLTVVSLVMFYLAVWSWQGCVLAMGLITVLACVARGRKDMVHVREEVA